jgi:AraC family transcriptional regulator
VAKATELQLSDMLKNISPDQIRILAPKDWLDGSEADRLVLVVIRGKHKPGIFPGKYRLSSSQETSIKDYIDNNIGVNIKTGDLAGLVRMSWPHFYRSFDATFGESPHQYLLNRRARYAVEKICNTDDALAQIAHISGFTDQAHMTRVVKKAIGQTPGALRKTLSEQRCAG